MTKHYDKGTWYKEPNSIAELRPKMSERSVYYGDEEHTGRRAYVMWCPEREEYFVEMIHAAGHYELRGMGIHSESYSGDCAENFVMGWGEFTDEYILSRQES